MSAVAETHLLSSQQPLRAIWNSSEAADTYVQAVSDEKRNAQSKVVEMLLPGIR